MFSGSRLYSFAPRKAKERWPVDNLHLGRFNCDMPDLFPRHHTNSDTNRKTFLQPRKNILLQESPDHIKKTYDWFPHEMTYEEWAGEIP